MWLDCLRSHNDSSRRANREEGLDGLQVVRPQSVHASRETVLPPGGDDVADAGVVVTTVASREQEARPQSLTAPGETVQQPSGGDMTVTSREQDAHPKSPGTVSSPLESLSALPQLHLSVTSSGMARSSQAPPQLRLSHAPVTSSAMLGSTPIESELKIRMQDIWRADVVGSSSCMLVGETRFRPEGLVLQSGGRFVVSDSINNKVKVFSGEGILQGFVGAKGRGCVRKPRSIVGFPNGTLAIYDLDDKSIKLFSFTRKFMYKIEGEFTNTSAPIAVTSEGDLLIPYRQSLVLQAVTDEKPGATLYRDVNTTVDLGKARDIAASREIVATCGMKRDDVLFININSGTVLRRLDFSAKLTNWPVGLQSNFFGISFDAAGNCYLLDTDNNNVVFVHKDPARRIVCFHCDGWIQRAMQCRRFEEISSTLLCPKCVCVDRSGDVIVLENLGKLKTFKLPSTTER